jgi:hypothetical protein
MITGSIEVLMAAAPRPAHTAASCRFRAVFTAPAR